MENEAQAGELMRGLCRRDRGARNYSYRRMMFMRAADIRRKGQHVEEPCRYDKDRVEAHAISQLTCEGALDHQIKADALEPPSVL